MADFSVLVKKVDVEPHPNADRLEIARIDGYSIVVRKGMYQTGNLAAYILEGSVERSLINASRSNRNRSVDKCE